MADTADGSRPEKDLDRRLQSLGARLDERRATQEANSKAASSPESKAGFARALKMSSEFVAAIMVGAGMGYLLDSFAGTAPWGLIVFLLLGFVAGVVNVLRSSGELADPYEGGWVSGRTGEKGDAPATGPDDGKE